MNLDQKIEVFSGRLAQDPHSRVFAPLADLLRQAGRWDDALELLDDGLGRHPDYASALVIKGRTLLDAGRMDQAREVLVRVLEMDPENFVVLRLLTEDARSRQAWGEAIPLLEKLVVLDPDDDRWAGALQEASGFAEGERSVEVSDSAFVTLTLVDIYLAQGYRAKALDALRQMIAREPGRSDLREKLAEIQAVGPATPPASPGMVPPGPEPGNGSGHPTIVKAADRRVNEKQKFEEWIHRIREEGGTGP